MMATKPKTEKVQVTGKVIRCKMTSQKPRFGYRVYDRGREHNDITLQITLETEEGKRYWFYTTPADYSINTSGPFSIAILHPNDWIGRKKERWDCEGFAGARGFGHLYESRIKEGDTIEIEGRVKNKNTKYGILLNFVKRKDFNYDTVHRAWQDRCAAARATVPATAPPDVTPPVIPGVEWHRTGGYPREGEPDRGIPSGQPYDHRWFDWQSEVKLIESLVAHVEGKPIEECQEPG